MVESRNPIPSDVARLMGQLGILHPKNVQAWPVKEIRFAPKPFNLMIATDEGSKTRVYKNHPVAEHPSPFPYHKEKIISIIPATSPFQPRMGQKYNGWIIRRRTAEEQKLQNGRVAVVYRYYFLPENPYLLPVGEFEPNPVTNVDLKNITFYPHHYTVRGENGGKQPRFCLIAFGPNAREVTAYEETTIPADGKPVDVFGYECLERWVVGGVLARVKKEAGTVFEFVYEDRVYDWRQILNMSETANEARVNAALKQLLKIQVEEPLREKCRVLAEEYGYDSVDELPPDEANNLRKEEGFATIENLLKAAATAALAFVQKRDQRRTAETKED